MVFINEISICTAKGLILSEDNGDKIHVIASCNLLFISFTIFMLSVIILWQKITKCSVEQMNILSFALEWLVIILQ